MDIFRNYHVVGYVTWFQNILKKWWKSSHQVIIQHATLYRKYEKMVQIKMDSCIHQWVVCISATFSIPATSSILYIPTFSDLPNWIFWNQIYCWILQRRILVNNSASPMSFVRYLATWAIINYIVRNNGTHADYCDYCVASGKSNLIQYRIITWLLSSICNTIC